MAHKKPAMSTLISLLLVATVSVSAFAPDASRAPDTNIPAVKEIAQAIQLPMSSWQQVNTNGFGDPHELEVSALEAFNSYLYAGTYNVIDPLQLFDGARIYRSADGMDWTPVTQPGFQNAHDTAPPAILDFVVFNNRLYASTGRGGNPAQIWRTSNGVNWAPMVSAGFSDPDLHDIAALAVYNSVIYAGASSQVSGARIYRSSTGDSNTWSPVAPPAPTVPGAGVTGFAVFNGALWSAIESEAPVQIWRSTGGAWTSVMNNGFGNSLTTSTGGMAVFRGYLYVGAGNAAAGAQLWRTSDGASWAQAISPGFGDPNNQKVEMVFVFQNQLYVSVNNAVTGMEVWHSSNGTLWEQASQDGFGDSNNSTSNRSNATADFLSQLYLGTSNTIAGGELWQFKTNRDIILSTGAYDGWVLESSETSSKGGWLNNTATTFYIGDDAQNKQYRSILSFSTKGLPDNAVITRITLKVKKQGIAGGGDPVNIFQGFLIDVKKGFIGSSPGLQVSDFQASADKSYGPLKPTLASGWYAINLTPAKAYINKLATNGGVTQVRLRFKLDDNGNNVANDLSLYSADALAASHPKLIIDYYVP
jgi:hypothetical protein